MTGGGKQVADARRYDWLWRDECVDRGKKGLRRVYVGVQLRRFADQRSLSGVLINGDPDRSLAARVLAGFQHDVVVRPHVCNGVVFIAATRLVHHRIHHCAREYRLRLHRPHSQQQEQQCPQGYRTSTVHHMRINACGAYGQQAGQEPVPRAAGFHSVSSSTICVVCLTLVLRPEPALPSSIRTFPQRSAPDCSVHSLSPGSGRADSALDAPSLGSRTADSHVAASNAWPAPVI